MWDKETHKKYRKVWDQSEKGKISHHKSRLKTFYNLTLEQYNEMLAKQQNRCLICKEEFNGTPYGQQIDHDHKTGKIRGILCGKCNTLLGLAHENIEILANAISYIEANRE